MREDDDDADAAEGEEEGDCGFAEAFEGFFDGWKLSVSDSLFRYFPLPV